MQKGGPARQPQPTRPGVQGLVGLTKILGLELGLPEAPLRGLWGVIWRSVPPVLSWSPQRANSQPGWLPTPLLWSSGWAWWREGSQPCALWAWTGCGGWGWATRPLCPPARCCPRAKPLLTRAGLCCGPWMALGPSRCPSWQIDGEKMQTVTDFIFLGSKITVDGDCSHEIERHLLLGRKAVTNLAY